MNLLAKNWNGLLIIASLSIFSCEDPSDIGLALDPNVLTAEVLYKELSLTAKNVYNDSLKTNNTGRLLVGRNVSDIFGTSTSTAYVRLSTQSSLPELVDDPEFTQKYVYDSVVINLQYNYINATDLNTTQTISVHELDDEMVGGVYYLSKFDTPYLPNEPEDVFDLTIKKDLLDSALKNLSVEPHYVVSERLSNTLGQKLFDVVDSDRIQENLRRVFKGIALVPGENNDAMIGFSPSGQSNITVHYHIERDHITEGISIPLDSLGLVFSMIGSNARYNKIDVDRSGSLIGNSIGENLATFETGNDSVYLNPSTGIYPKVSLDALHAFFDGFDEDNGEYIQILRAEFVISTVANAGMYRANANNLRFLFTNEGKQVNTAGLNNQDMRSTIVITDAGYLGAAQQAALAPFDADLMYRAPVTFFVQQLQKGELYADKDAEGNITPLEALTLMPNDLSITNYSVFGNNDVKLKLYYALTN